MLGKYTKDENQQYLSPCCWCLHQMQWMLWSLQKNMNHCHLHLKHWLTLSIVVDLVSKSPSNSININNMLWLVAVHMVVGVRIRLSSPNRYTSKCFPRLQRREKVSRRWIDKSWVHQLQGSVKFIETTSNRENIQTQVFSNPFNLNLAKSESLAWRAHHW